MFRRLLSSLFAGILMFSPGGLSASNSSNMAKTASSLPFKITTKTPLNDKNYVAPVFPILPFEPYANNPVLTPNPGSNFESKYLYNPTAIVLNDTIFLLYRAQNSSKTSSIGLAWSKDGVSFTRLDRPIIYATEPWEHIGGTEGECGNPSGCLCKAGSLE